MSKPEQLEIIHTDCSSADQKAIDIFNADKLDDLESRVDKDSSGLRRDDNEGIKSTAYQLMCLASQFHRHDIANTAELLVDVLCDPNLDDRREVLAHFHEALTILNSFKAPNDAKEHENLQSLTTSIARINGQSRAP